ncbi:MAG: alpha/beta hydrolase [Acidimicrobiia bacterium]|jgi:pimeloyl-ACP methyl ester carboxylesterase
MPEVTVNGISIHYERMGEGPPMVLLHGLGSSSRDWENQKSFSDRFEMLIPDLRGHGRSSKPPGPYSISQFSDDVAALLETTGVRPATIVGISLGGMVAFQLAADHPELVSRLVIVNALPDFEMTSIGQRIQITIRKLMTKWLSMRRIGEVLSKRLFPAPDNVGERETMVERWAENDKSAYEASFEAIVSWSGVADAMSRFDKPTTVISSELDYVPPQDKIPYVEAMPSAEMVVIDDAHHGVPMEMPGRFNVVLAGVLA